MERIIDMLKRFSYIAVYVMPITIIIGLLKLLFHSYEWEILGLGHYNLLAAVFTGIIFLLGFLLVGVLADHKESEKMPTEIITSLYSILREAIMLSENGISAAENIRQKVIDFCNAFRIKFLIHKSENEAIAILDSFMADFTQLYKAGVSYPIIAMMKKEQENLRKILIRIKVTRDTQFAPGAYGAVELIIFFYVIGMLLMDFESALLGAFLVSLYSFVLISILIVIKDIDNPFEYGKKSLIKINEIDFSELDKFYDSIIT